MAGRGTRLRPHTISLPKPLMKIAGKTMIEWIVDEIKQSCDSKIDEIHYIIGDFGQEVEQRLVETAKKIGSKGYIHYQVQPLGTAHALYCAKSALDGEVFIVFADTIFKGKIKIDNNVDGMIWTMNVEDPEKYGVVKTDDNGIITDFIEKPKEYVSSNAIVGLYYFKAAQRLRYEIDELINNDLRENNEYQLTNCLESLKKEGDKLKCAELEEWLDCGNKQELLNTHKRILEIENPSKQSFIHETAELINCTIGEGVSVDEGVKLDNCKLDNCIIYSNTSIENSDIKNAIIGHNCLIKGLEGSAFIGDYSEYEKA